MSSGIPSKQIVYYLGENIRVTGSGGLYDDVLIANLKVKILI
jgi:hypothetical protein